MWPALHQIVMTPGFSSPADHAKHSQSAKSKNESPGRLSLPRNFSDTDYADDTVSGLLQPGGSTMGKMVWAEARGKEGLYPHGADT